MENEIQMEQILELDKLYYEGEYLECKRLLLDMLEQEPGFGRAHDLMGCLYYFVLDDYEKAVKHMRLAVKFAPEYPAAYINYARLLNHLNRKEELLELTAAAIKVEGVNKCIVFIERGRAYEQNGDTKQALHSYVEAERYAFTLHEVEEVNRVVKRVKQKMRSKWRRVWPWGQTLTNSSSHQCAEKQL